MCWMKPGLGWERWGREEGPDLTTEKSQSVCMDGVSGQRGQGGVNDGLEISARSWKPAGATCPSRRGPQWCDRFYKERHCSVPLWTYLRMSALPRHLGSQVLAVEVRAWAWGEKAGRQQLMLPGVERQETRRSKESYYKWTQLFLDTVSFNLYTKSTRSAFFISIFKIRKWMPRKCSLRCPFQTGMSGWSHTKWYRPSGSN